MMNLFSLGVARAISRLRSTLGQINMVIPSSLEMFFDEDGNDTFYTIETIDAMLRDIVSSVILTSYLPGTSMFTTSGSKKTNVLHALHVLGGNESIAGYRASYSYGKDGNVYTALSSYSIEGKQAMLALPYLEGVCMRTNVIMDMIFEQDAWHHYIDPNEVMITGLHKATIAKIGMQMVQDKRFGVELIKDPRLDEASFQGTSAKMVTKIMNDFVRKHNLPVRTGTVSVIDNSKIETMKVDSVTCLS
jgi:hypothetical protein